METILQRFLKVFHFKKTEKITRAFGMKLGSSFNPSKAIEKGKTSNNTSIYRFYPKHHFRSFTRYYVSITPKTHKIYKIWATNLIKDSKKCKKEQEDIMLILEKKHGQLEKIESIPNAKIINQGNRDITCICRESITYTIAIQYTDQKLTQLANKEKFEISIGE